jgi:hypothetical protein
MAKLEAVAAAGEPRKCGGEQVVVAVEVLRQAISCSRFMWVR